MPADRRRTDEELLRHSAAGDQNAFSELMLRHQDRIFGLALRMLGNRADALDATQDAFISVFRRAERFRGDAAVGTWLYRIAINACNDLARKRSRWSSQDDHDGHETRATAIDEEIATRLDVAAALARIPDEYRDAVVMHDLGGIPYDEIARLTDVAVGTVKSRISRGRRRLAELLEQGPPLESSKERT